MAYSWSIYRRYLPIIKKLPKKRYDEIFGDKQRIYLPFTNEQELTNGIYETKIANILNGHSYYIIDYKQGTCREAFGNERLVRIGRTLQMLAKKRVEYLQALEEFTTDPYRTGAKIENMLICISRHPYDIIGMSTGRGWTSCMDNVTGGMTRYIEFDLRCGTIIAYLIKEDDKNIKNPISRIAIKAFQHDKNYLLIPVQRIYGAQIKNFQKAVNDWAFKIQQKKTKKIDCYHAHPNLYLDKLSNSYVCSYVCKKEAIDYSNSLFPALAVGVKNQTESREFQEIVFKAGGRWQSGDTHFLREAVQNHGEDTIITLSKPRNVMTFGSSFRNDSPYFTFEGNKEKIEKITKLFLETSKIGKDLVPENLKRLSFQSAPLAPFIIENEF